MSKYNFSFEKQGFIEDSFVGGFNEDLIYEYLAERCQTDVLMKVVDKGVLPEGFSRFGMFDLDEEKFVVSRDTVDDVFYEVRPDYVPIRAMYDNFDKYDSGYEGPYEYVPVANPIIPTNKLYDYDETRSVDDLFISQGYKIVDPTPSQVGKGDPSSVVEYSDSVTGKLFDRFCSKIDSPAAFSGAEIVGLQFNPFNPRGARIVTALVWDTEFSVSGTYEYRSKVYRFNYDLKSTYFRIHSDVWMPFMGVPQHSQYHYQMYDLISVKPMFEGHMLDRTRNVAYPGGFTGVFVEPFFSDRETVLGYSVIGPWPGEIYRGTSAERFFVPSLTCSFARDDSVGGVHCSVVTNFSCGDGVIIDREKGVRIKYDRGKLYSAEYYYRPYGVGGTLLRLDPDGSRLMYKFPFPLIGEFRNNKGSLIDHVSTISVTSYIHDLDGMIGDRVLNHQDWASYVAEGEDDYGLVEFDKTEIQPPIVVTKYSNRSHGVPDKMINTINRIAKKPRPVVLKTMDEKIIAARTNAVLGDGFKNKNFVPHYFSKLQ